MDRLFIFLGAISGFCAVMTGAFGAHGLKGRIAPEMLAVFETGARYQMYHALALFAVAWCAVHLGGRLPATARVAVLAFIRVFIHAFCIFSPSATVIIQDARC